MKTPIEYLIEKLTESGHLWLTDKPSDMDDLALIIKNAKEVEKQEMSIMFNYAMETEAGQPVFSEPDFEQYFKERYTQTQKL